MPACCGFLYINIYRFGIGRFTTEAEIDYAVDKCVEQVNRLREMRYILQPLLGGHLRWDAKPKNTFVVFCDSNYAWLFFYALLASIDSILVHSGTWYKKALIWSLYNGHSIEVWKQRHHSVVDCSVIIK